MRVVIGEGDVLFREGLIRLLTESAIGSGNHAAGSLRTVYEPRDNRIAGGNGVVSSAPRC